MITNNVLSQSEKYQWEDARVMRVIDNEHLLLNDYRVIKIIGIDAPPLIKPKKSDQCYARPAFRILKSLLENQDIKILRDKTDKLPSGIHPRHIRVGEIKYLSEYMLENGLARFESDGDNIRYDKKYKKVAEEAETNKIGIWAPCGLDEVRQILKHQAGIARQNFNKHYGHQLAPISVGKVVEVETGNTFTLENGLEIKMLGIQVPHPDDPRTGFACFGQASKRYLEHLILGRIVHLRKDKSQFEGDSFVLQRYVYIPPKTKNDQEIFVNKQMVKDGYAKSVWPGIDEKYKALFETVQTTVYAHPTGAWASCIEAIMQPKEKPASPEKPVDPECPIKGNISGSKKNPIKKYHTPASGWYERLEYEACFQTEAEASDAGFVKVK